MFKVDANTLEDYFNFDPQRKQDLQSVDVLIRKTVPDLKRWFYPGAPIGEPGMRMKMIAYGQFQYTDKRGNAVDWPIIILALQKNYITIYTSTTKNGSPIINNYKGQLGELKLGKNNFSFRTFNELNQQKVIKLLNDIDETVKKDPKSLTHGRSENRTAT